MCSVIITAPCASQVGLSLSKHAGNIAFPAGVLTFIIQHQLIRLQKWGSANQTNGNVLAYLTNEIQLQHQ